MSRDWFWDLVLLVAVVLTYLPVWRADFIWDDDIMISANACIVGPYGLKEIWTTGAADICPLTLTFFWLEHALWGVRPLPYHLVDVALHGANAIILWRVLRRLQIPGAWLGAAFWALHPVEVESVAWVTETKNTLSGLFYLLTIFFYLRTLRPVGSDVHPARGRDYARVPLFAALAMAAKSSTVILPLVVCLCAWWIEGRWHWRNLLKVAPLFLFALLAGAASIYTQTQQGFTDAIKAPGLPERLAAGGDAVWFYLGKLLWPHPLLTIYPQWKIDPDSLLSYLSLLAVVVSLAILWLKRGSWGRIPFFVAAYFLIALLPALGFVNMVYFRYSFVADHFQYLASMGPLALLGAGIAHYSRLVVPARAWLFPVLRAGLLVFLGVLSWSQARIYENVHGLWSYTIAFNPTSATVQNGFGMALYGEGRLDEAMDHFKRALELNPIYSEACNNLANVFFHQGRLDEAIAQYRKAILLNPKNAEPHNNLGAVLYLQRKFDEAITQEKQAVGLQPLYSEAYNNLGNALLQKGRLDEGIAEYQKALQIDPTYAEAENNLAVAFFHKGLVKQALDSEREALRQNPDYRDAQNNLARMEAILAKRAAPETAPAP